MEPSPRNSTQSPSKPKNNVIETPRTSNLNFLRAKRLNYFCGKSSQNPLLKTEASQDAGQSFRTATPRRRLSVPSSSHVIAYSDVPEKMSAEFKAMSVIGETSLQGTEEKKPPAPTFPQDVHGNPGKEELTNIPANHTQPLPITEMEGKERTKYRKTPNKSIPNSLQPKISNPPVPSVHLNLQPVTTKHKKDIPIQQDPQAMLEKDDGKVSFIDPIFQSSHKEVEINGSPSYHGPMSTLYQVKNDKHIPHSQIKPDLDEFDVLSTHRSLLRSSFVTDLDQDLLEDLSVPETEKLHHVMTWAKKFLDKCNGGELTSATGDTLMKNMTEDSSLDSIGSTRITDKHLRLGYCDSKKLPGLGDEVRVSLKSPRSLAKPKLKSKQAQLDPFLAGPKPNLFQRDHEEYEDNFFEPLLVKYSGERDNLKMKDFADSGEDLFGTRPNHQLYNTHIFRDIKSAVALKDNDINRDYESSSPDSCLNTERLTSILEDLELKEKGLKNTGDNDGGRTDRTFLVKKSENSDDNTYILVSGKIPDRRQPAAHKVDSNMDLSDGCTREICQECPACSFTNTTSSNWCSECGLALNRAEVHPFQNYELSNPYISDDKDVDDFFSINNQKRSFDNSISQKNAKELGRAVCWEDNSDVVSDSEGSVLDKYLFYVKQLDTLRSQEKEQNNFYQSEYTSETSSDDEPFQDDFRLRASGQSKPWGETKTLAPEIHHFGDEAMKERTLIGSNEHIIRTEGSNVKGLLGKEFADNDNF